VENGMALQPKKSEIKRTKPAGKAMDDAAGPAAEASAADATDVFDVDRVRKFVELMQEFDLGMLDLRQGNQRVLLRRGNETVVMANPGSAAPLPPQYAAPQSQQSSAPTAPRPAEPTAGGKKTAQIKSPMVGTFYPSPKPESPPYVKVGDMVSPETTVCIIEAMKVFNELPAEASGRIVAILVEAGAPVEYGQALFEIEPA
jgi:acetyl-CoA carboxylase biotin carboxyl carrier protein